MLCEHPIMLGQLDDRANGFDWNVQELRKPAGDVVVKYVRVRPTYLVDVETIKPGRFVDVDGQPSKPVLVKHRFAVPIDFIVVSHEIDVGVILE